MNSSKSLISLPTSSLRVLLVTMLGVMLAASSARARTAPHSKKLTSRSSSVAATAATSGAVSKIDPGSHLRYTGGAIEGDFTMMGMFKITINRGALSTFIIMGGPEEPMQRFINSVSLSTDDDGESFRVQGLVGDPGFVGPDLGVGGWHHLAMVGNTAPGSPIFGYIDGLLAITGTINASGTYVPEMIEISGCWGQDVFRLAGSFCAMKIWSAQLSQSEIQSEMLFYRAVHRTSLWQEVPLRNTTDLFDLSGNGRDLVASGPALADDADGPDIQFDPSGTPDCSNLDDDCNIGVFNELTSLCEAHPRPNGTPCEDGLFCTSGDGCVDGICIGGASPCALLCEEANDICVECLSVLDCNDGIACTDDSCNSGACVHQTNNSLCEDDGLFCNGQEVCSAQLGCISTGNPCPPNDVCNEDTNSCVECQNSEDCIVDNPCILGRACVEGQCQGGTPVDCSAFGDQCNASMCDTFGAPGNCDIRTALDDGTPCDDGLFCTTGDACLGGACKSSTPRDCSTLSDQCHEGACDENSDTCVALTLNDGTSCDDGLFCTIGDRCEAGQCRGDQRDCSEFANACNQAECNEETNVCESNPVENGTTCDDGDACTLNDSCTDGTCHGQQLFGLPEWQDMADCLKGPGVAVSVDCECSDLNHDGHVDLRDVAIFMNEFATP